MKHNIVWIDYLRVIACFLVVLAHSVDPFVSRFDSNYSDFISGAFWGSFLRPCVPLFVMISGVLLLPVKEEMSLFYRKRIPRVVVPLFVWSVILPIAYYIYFSMGIATQSPCIDTNGHTFSATVGKIVSFIFNFNYTTIPLWYLYMLVGIYLILPIVSAWLVQAPKRDILRVIWVWIFSTTVPLIQMAAPLAGYVGNYGNMGVFGVCDWNPYGTFYYFSGFIGYVILAYYLIKFPLNWSWRKTLSIALPIWIVGYLITSLGFILTQKYYPGSYAQLEIIWLFSGLNVLMMTFPVFIIIQKISFKPSKFVSLIASLSFGVYLCHFFVIQVCYDLIYPYIDLPPYLQIPLIAICSFVLSAVGVWILSLLPKNKYIIG